MKKETISSQVFTKNNEFQILEKKSEKIGKRYKYEYKVKCVKCGEERITTHKDRIVCKNCKELKKFLDYVNQEIGNYSILKFLRIEGDERFYEVMCKNCGDISEKKLTTIQSSKNNKSTSCSHCKYLKRSETHKPTLQAVKNCVRSSYISGAKGRNLSFDLTNEQFEELIQQDCYYCGSFPTEYKMDKRFNKTNEIFKRNGIDRKDSDLNYTINNCVPCCHTCNLMKMTLHHDDFINHIININTYLVNKGSTTSA